jgi:hypothetical protein
MPAKKKANPATVTTRELAAALEVSGQRIRQLTTDGIIRCIAANTYDLEECRSAYAKWKERRKPKDGMDETKLRKLQAEAAILEHKLSVQRGEYVSHESMRADGEKLGLAIRAAFQRAPADLTPRLAGRKASEVSVILREYMRAKLLELSQYESTITIPAD